MRQNSKCERLPTKVNLRRRNVLSSSDNLKCVLCGEKEETGSHIFFECDFSYKVWMPCFNWLGISTALHSKPWMNLLSQCYLFKWKRGRQNAISIWLCVVWMIWKYRNAFIFFHE
ncbi:hypothetical protein ACS0TY_011345 [Phlomoides rotata]